MNLNPEEMSRYARHLSLPEIGISGQKLLKESAVLCIGTGGLGSPLLMYLAAAGVGRIGIVDYDLVEESNLQRQVIHGTSWIGKSKIDSSRSRILEINPYCLVETFNTLLTTDNAMDIIGQFDIVCDCTDNFPSRYLINDSCYLLKKVLVYGSISQFEGQVSVFNLNENSPNYRDLVPEPPPIDLLPSCAEGGVMGVLPGLIGIIQATEVIKIITNIGSTLDGRVMVFNALKMTFRELTLKKNQESVEITKLINYNIFCNQSTNDSDQGGPLIEHISIKMLKNLIKNKYKKICIVDVRTHAEFKTNSIHGSYCIPLKEIKEIKNIEFLKSISNNQEIFIICQSGFRSLNAIKILHKFNIQVKNIEGGMNAWNIEMSKP